MRSKNGQGLAWPPLRTDKPGLPASLEKTDFQRTIKMERALNILYLCTGNSCRSQMAEGWTRALGAGKVSVESAGIEAHGKNPRAISTMLEAGVDISGQESSIVSEAMLERADIVVTVCGHADEQCPVLPPGVKKNHWPLSDPAKAEGSEEEIMATFRATRDEVKKRVSELLKSLPS
jgi:arsenate reductase